jgi:hypothetical protein
MIGTGTSRLNLNDSTAYTAHMGSIGFWVHWPSIDWSNGDGLLRFGIHWAWDFGSLEILDLLRPWVTWTLDSLLEFQHNRSSILVSLGRFSMRLWIHLRFWIGETLDSHNTCHARQMYSLLR